MVTFAQLRAARPNVLTGAAEAWEQQARATGRRAVELHTEVLDGLTRWSGPAARAATAKLNHLIGELTEARTAMQHVSDILGEAGTAITRAQADLLSAAEYAHRRGLTVEDDGSVSWLDWNPLEWAADREAAQHAADLVEGALRRANEADADAAADLRVARLAGQDKAPLSALSMSDDPQVESAVQRFHELLGEAGSFEFNGNRDELQQIAEVIAGLSPAERDAFLAQLSDEDLRTWRQYLRGTSDVLWNADGLPRWDRLDLDTSLLSAVSGETVNRLTEAWPQLQPTPPDGSEYAKPGGPPDDGTRNWQDINQGGVGDCWALATLAGQGKNAPSFYDQMLQQNANGTVSVRLYDDEGNAHRVTVTGDLPADSNGKLAGASGDSGDRDMATAENWPAYIEKALARTYEDGDESTSGYQNLDGDAPANAFRHLTGYEADSKNVIDVNTDAIKERVDAGQPVVVSTKGSSDDIYIYENESGPLAGNHAYFVKDVLPDGRVVLGNPWGPGYTTSEVVLDQEELREHGVAITVRK